MQLSKYLFTKNIGLVSSDPEAASSTVEAVSAVESKPVQEVAKESVVTAAEQKQVAPKEKEQVVESKPKSTTKKTSR